RRSRIPGRANVLQSSSLTCLLPCLLDGGARYGTYQPPQRLWGNRWPHVSGKNNETTPALRAGIAKEDFMLAIESLIVNRSTVLGLSRPDLVRRATYKNIAKGLWRLDELLAGEIDKARDLFRALPAALDLPDEVVGHAIEQTRRRMAEAQEATRQGREEAWRAAFKSHAIILTERIVPQPIYVVSIVGVERVLRIDFNIASPPVSYAAQALAGIRRRLSEFRIESGSIPDALPAIGRPIGVIVNYTPDNAIRFDSAAMRLKSFHAHIVWRSATLQFAVARFRLVRSQGSYNGQAQQRRVAGCNSSWWPPTHLKKITRGR